MKREEINNALRGAVSNILNRKLTEREKEIKELARKEKEEYERKRIAFYNNPLHWSNNKRRMYGLPVLRGQINKYRNKHYPSFRPTIHLFCTIEDVINETIGSKLCSNEFFGEFIEFKNMNVGEQNKYYFGVDLANGKDFSDIKHLR